jgi:hypothetical protein
LSVVERSGNLSLLYYCAGRHYYAGRLRMPLNQRSP